jgi:hypothetical protein
VQVQAAAARSMLQPSNHPASITVQQKYKGHRSEVKQRPHK